MSDNKIYYYMRLKENFFDSDELIYLESMEYGYIYSNILLKLYLRSLKRNGKLMLNDVIPYNIEILSKITRHDKDVVEKALEVLKSLGLIDVLSSGAIYMLNIQEFIGKSSTEADRKREYRARIEKDKCQDKSEDKCPDIVQENIHHNKSKVREEKELKNTLFNSLTLKEGETPPPSAGAGGASPFTLIDCQKCVNEGKVNLSEDGIKAFYDRMQKDGWEIKGAPVTNLLKAMRGFAKNHKRYQKQVSEKEEPETESISPVLISKKAVEYMPSEIVARGGWGKYIPEYCPSDIFTDEEKDWIRQKWNVEFSEA